MRKEIILIIILSLLSLWPFFKKGFFESHDGEWMVIRFSAFHQTLAAGQFPVRFVDRLNNNYGYPVLNFLYPLPFYISEIPKILGFNFVDSIKITFITTTIFSSVAMFWALAQFFSRYASLAGSIVYLFIPYRFVDLYVRGSLGENLAFALAPLILGSIFKIAKGHIIFLPILSISVGSLVLAHNVIAALFLPIFFLISILLIKKEILKTIAAFLAGFLMSTFFWLPALYNLQFVRLSQINISNISDHLSSINKLIIPSWGYGPMPQGDNGFSPQIGLISMAVFVSAVYLFFKSRKKDIVIGLLLIIFTVAIFSMTRLSSALWQNIPYINVIQFPWRLLSIIVLISVLLTAFVVDSVKNKVLVSTLIIIASVVLTIIYTKPASFVDRGEGFYATNEDTTTVRDEYLPLWIKEKPKLRANQKIETSGNGDISSAEIKPAHYQAVINARKETTVKINSIYFPGWQAFVDGGKANISYRDNPHGLMSIKLPEGSHEVIIKYARSPVHLASEIISLLSLIGTGSYLVFLWRKQNS